MLINIGIFSVKFSFTKISNIVVYYFLVMV